MTDTATTGAKPGITDRAKSAVEVRKDPTLIDLVKQSEGQIKLALPAFAKDNAEGYVRSAITLLKQTPSLAKCDPMTVLGGIMTASQLGLEFGPLGHAYLVPYKGKATLIVGYKGLIDLAYRSGKLLSIEARTVYANDHFEYEYGLHPKLEHKPSLAGDRGEPLCWYGVAHLKGGGYYFEVLSRSDIERHRKFSASSNSSSSPWKSDYDAMARKTVIRSMQPYLPLTTDERQGFSMDGATIAGSTPEDLDVLDEEPWPIVDEDGVVEGEIVEDEA